MDGVIQREHASAKCPTLGSALDLCYKSKPCLFPNLCPTSPDTVGNLEICQENWGI